MIGDVPLAVDFPNHAARLFIECNLGDPALSRMYSVEYSLIPNLAIDLLNQPFCGLVDPMTFLRGTLVLTMAGILLVVWKLHTHLNDRPNAFVLLAPAMTFNLVTSMGYLNYLIGTFLFLLFAWVMLRFDVLRRHRALAIALPNLFGGLIFLCHIFAVALAGVFLFGLRLAAESGRPWLARTVRAGALTAVSFAVPLAMMLLAERSGFGFAYAIAAKIRTLWAPMIYLNIVVSGGIAVAWLVLFYWSFRERHAFVAPQMRWPVVSLFGDGAAAAERNPECSGRGLPDDRLDRLLSHRVAMPKRPQRRFRSRGDCRGGSRDLHASPPGRRVALAGRSFRTAGRRVKARL